MDPNGSGAGSESHLDVPELVPRSDRQRLEQVVIRFAGDSGDGMQLTGDRFTSEAALFGNDLATQPNYPAEIRAPAGTLPGVSSFQIQIADYDILTAGDRPDVLVAMNPAALKANIGDLPRGGMVIANSDEFTKRNLTKVGYVTNPLETDELSDYVVHSVAMTTLTLGAVEAIGASKKDGQRAKNMFALGLLSWMYGRPIEASETLHPGEVRPQARHRRGQRARPQGGLELRRNHRGFRHHLRGVPRDLAGRRIPADLGQHRAGLRHRHRRSAGRHSGRARQLSDHAGLGHPARAVQAQELQRDHVPGRRRDRRHLRGTGRLLRRRARRHQHLGPGHLAEVRGARPGRDDRAAAARHRRAARRTVDRPAHQDRAGRPAAGVVRPQRGVAGGGAGAAIAVRLFRDRARGGAHRGVLSHPGDRAVRRLDRQRLRAVANPGRRHAASRSSTPSPNRTSRSSPTPATRRHSLANSPFRARPVWNIASAAWKRRTAPATSPTSRSITT